MKKFLTILLTVVLTAAVAITGTVAYLTAEDSDVNTMTFGNVKIDQHEYERVINDNGEYEIVDFTQDKPIYPAVGTPAWATPNQAWPTGGSSALFADSFKNVLDKFVFVENTGISDAYVRTWFAFEVGEYDGAKFEELIGININGTHYKWAPEEQADWEIVEIGGNKYAVGYATYLGNAGANNDEHKDGVLGKGETTRPSLLQVYLANTADYEDCVALDGNGNGRYDILVFSQAVQVKGFEEDGAEKALETAFGNEHPWVGENVPVIPGLITSDEALAKAIQDGETELALASGTFHMPAAAKGKTLTINGNKNTIIEVVPAGQGEAGGQLDYNLDGSNVTFNGVTIKTNSKTYAGYARLSAVYNNCTIQNTYNLGVGTSEFNNCTFNITNEYLRVGGAYEATFNKCVFNTDGRAILVYQDGTNVAQTVTVKDCTFNATAAANTWNGIHVAAVSIDGSQGGTYVVNLEGTNTVDSDFNGLYQIKAQKDPSNVTVN